MRRSREDQKSKTLTAGRRIGATQSRNRNVINPTLEEKAKTMRPTRGGFSVDTPVNERGIPEYNAVSDRHCPYTKTAKFLAHYSASQVKKEKSREARSQRLQAAGVKSRRKRRQAWEDRAPSPVDTSAMSKFNTIDDAFTPSRSITWADAAEADAGSNDVDPSVELDVLKSILLREGYIERMRNLLRKSGRVTDEAIDLVDLLRLSTVEVAEAIAVWRRKLGRSKPFVWNGFNYLLKIPSDLDFVNGNHALTSYLGFPVKRNPFLIPPEHQLGAQRPSSASLTGSMHLQDLEATGAETFVSVGRGTGEAMQETGGGLPRKLEGAANSTSLIGQAYNTRVVSGVGLRAPTHGELMAAGGIGAKSSLAAASEAADPLATLGPAPPGVTTQKIAPSHIGDLDMLRVREAERMIEAEERVHGRWTRNPSGHLIPEQRPLDYEARAMSPSQSKAAAIKTQPTVAKQRREKGEIDRDSSVAECVFRRQFFCMLSHFSTSIYRTQTSDS